MNINAIVGKYLKNPAELIGKQPAFPFGEAKELWGYEPLIPKPGIQKQVRPGHILLFRCARSVQEADQIRDAINLGTPGKAFRASQVRYAVEYHGQAFARKFNTLLKQGKEPVFAGVVPTVTVYYTQWAFEEGGGVFAIEIKEKDLLYVSPRAQRLLAVIHGANPTGYDAHSVSFPDTEVLFDAKKVTRVAEIPLPLVRKLNALMTEFELTHVRKGYFRGSMKVKDPELAGEKIRDVADLNPKITETLYRPFVEVPVETIAGTLVKGDKVLLANGSTAVVKNMRRLEARFKQYSPEAKEMLFELMGIKGELPYTTDMMEKYKKQARKALREVEGTDKEGLTYMHKVGWVPATEENITKDAIQSIQWHLPLNFPDTFILRKIEPGERVSAAEKARLKDEWEIKAGLK